MLSFPPPSSLAPTNTDCSHTTPSCNIIRTVICWWTSKFWIMKQKLNISASSSLNGEWNTNWYHSISILRNASECAICTFKAHFLSILAGISHKLPNNLWDLLLPQAELTLNLLWQYTLTPNISAWEYFQGPFNYNITPIVPLGCPVISHRKT